jgi:hypothetical protein
LEVHDPDLTVRYALSAFEERMTNGAAGCNVIHDSWKLYGM